jgi:hypothetical protein
MNQPLRNNGMIIVDYIHRDVFNLHIRRPGHNNHHYAGIADDKPRQERVAKQLLEFFFNEEL